MALKTSILNINIWLIGLVILYSSCEDPTSTVYQNSNINDQQPSVHTTELIAFGAEDKSINNKNKGYAAAFYAKFNLIQDSIYVRQQIGFYDIKEVKVKAGRQRNLLFIKELVNLIGLVKQLDPGMIRQTEIPEDVLYCGKDYCLVYTNGSKVKRYYFTRYNLFGEFETIIDYARSLLNDPALSETSDTFNADKIISPIVNDNEFPDFQVILPPPINSTIIFTPPIVNKNPEE